MFKLKKSKITIIITVNRPLIESLQPNVLELRYFKYQIIKVWNIEGLQGSKDIGIRKFEF